MAIDVDAFFVDSGITFTPQLLTVDTAPSPAAWAVGAIITGATSGTTAQIIKVVGVTEKIYEIAYLTEDFILGEELSDGTNAIDCNGTHPTVAGTSSTAIGGLKHLIGETVQVLGDGIVYTPTAVVDANGAITIGTAVETAQVGLASTYKIQTMKLGEVTGQGIAYGSIKKITEVAFNFLNTLGVEYGADEDTLYPIADNAWSATALNSGLFTITLDGGFSMEDSIWLAGSDPLPCIIRAIIPRVDKTGR